MNWLVVQMIHLYYVVSYYDLLYSILNLDGRIYELHFRANLIAKTTRPSGVGGSERGRVD